MKDVGTNIPESEANHDPSYDILALWIRQKVRKQHQKKGAVENAVFVEDFLLVFTLFWKRFAFGYVDATKVVLEIKQN